MHDGGVGAPCSETFHAARRHEAELAAQLGSELVNTFVTPLDREDLAAINIALYRVSSAAGKLVARHTLLGQRLRGVDFSAYTERLCACADVVVGMVGELRSALRIDPMQKHGGSGRILSAQCADRSLHLEPGHLVVGPAVEFQPRAGRWLPAWCGPGS